MSTSPPSSNDALSAYLQQAAADLAESNDALGADAEGLLFLGAWHQSYPAILVRDPFLSDSAKVQFLYLMQESSQSPHNAIAMPSLLETGRVLGHAKKTVHRDRTLLRVCRWISQHKRVRDDKGRYCGSINAIHSEPCALNEAHRLDATYLQLLDDSRTHPDRYVQRAAQAALASIDQALQEGRDPLEPPDPLSRRLDSARAVQNGGGSFFDLLMPESGPIAKAHDPSSAGHTVASTGDDAKFTLGGAGASDPSVNFDRKQAGHTVGSTPNEAKFTPGQQGEPSPSVNFDAYEAGHTVASAQAGVNSTLGGPGAKFTPGRNDPSVKFTPESQVTDNKENSASYPHQAKFTPSSPTVRSSSTTTTDSTTDAARASRPVEQRADAHPEALRWPKALAAEQRTQIGDLTDFRQLTSTQQQDVLDAIDHKLADPDDPLRKPAGYAFRLCKRIEAGTFNPIGAPGCAVEAVDPRSRADREAGPLRQQLREIQSEVSHLESTLIPGTPPETRAALETQRDRLRDQATQLKSRLRDIFSGASRQDTADA